MSIIRQWNASVTSVCLTRVSIATVTKSYPIQQHLRFQSLCLNVSSISAEQVGLGWDSESQFSRRISPLRDFHHTHPGNCDRSKPQLRGATNFRLTVVGHNCLLMISPGLADWRLANNTAIRASEGTDMSSKRGN